MKKFSKLFLTLAATVIMAVSFTGCADFLNALGNALFTDLGSIRAEGYDGPIDLTITVYDKSDATKQIRKENVYFVGPDSKNSISDIIKPLEYFTIEVPVKYGTYAEAPDTAYGDYQLVSYDKPSEKFLAAGNTNLILRRSGSKTYLYQETRDKK